MLDMLGKAALLFIASLIVSHQPHMHWSIGFMCDVTNSSGSHDVSVVNRVLLLCDCVGDLFIYLKRDNNNWMLKIYSHSVVDVTRPKVLERARLCGRRCEEQPRALARIPFANPYSKTVGLKNHAQPVRARSHILEYKDRLFLPRVPWPHQFDRVRIRRLANSSHLNSLRLRVPNGVWTNNDVRYIALMYSDLRARQPAREFYLPCGSAICRYGESMHSA